MTKAMTDTSNFLDPDVLLQPGRHLVILPVDGRDRRFFCITPANIKPGEKLPVVFFFHGAGGTAHQAMTCYGWAEKAEQNHFFAIFPEGFPIRLEMPMGPLLNPHIWRDERGGAHSRLVNDVHFFEVLLARLLAALPIDSHRVHVTGFSNGAGMTFTLGAYFSDRLASIAPVSSQSFAQANTLARPLPIYFLTGTADPLIPLHGGIVKLPWGTSPHLPPIQDSINFWVRLNGCSTTPEILNDHNGVRVVRYSSGGADSEIIFTTVEGNGHHWPTSIEKLPPAIRGPSLDPFSATDRIWDFFQKHPLPSAL